MSLCECTTLKGMPCKSFKKRGTNYCSFHQNCQEQRTNKPSFLMSIFQSKRKTISTIYEDIGVESKGLLIRATKEDVPKIKELADNYMKIIGHFEEKSLEDVENIVLNSETYVYKNPDVQGFITIISDKKLLRLLVVDQNYRNLGIATKLMNFVSTKNFSLYIEKNNPYYDILVKFYTKYKFKIVEENTDFVKMQN